MEPKCEKGPEEDVLDLISYEILLSSK